MADEPLDASPAATSAAAVGASAPAPAPAASPVLRPRREAFEHGLLPIPKLVFPEGTLTQTLAQLKERLAAPGGGRVGAAALAEALQIPAEQAALALGTLVAVLPTADEDPAPGVDGTGDADLRDLLLFLYIQSYKRLVPRAHKDSPAVADVWPSTSAFDGYLSALSPIQLVRSNSRRFMPSQADEEAHQLSYLQKHMANILTLLVDSVDGEGDESMVLTMETFEHLGFLLQFSEGTPLSQAATFFANSDPDMPAAPVPAAQIHDWILQNIASSLEYTAEKSTTKENSQQSISDPDVTMADAVTNTRIQSSSPTGASVQNNPGYYRNASFVEGISKTSVVKQASDIKGHSIKVLNCHDSVIYILAPLKYATVYGCSDTTVVLGAIGKVVKVEHCERVQIIAASKRICIANCRECIFYLGVNHQPLIVGDNHKLQVAPFNTYYPQLGEHLAQVGVDPNVNKWDQPFVLGVVDPHDSLSHPAGVSDVQAESATCLDPDLFTNFLIPSWFEAQGPTKYNPFTLPEVYWASQRKKCNQRRAAIKDECSPSRDEQRRAAARVHDQRLARAHGQLRARRGTAALGGERRGSDSVLDGERRGSVGNGGVAGGRAAAERYPPSMAAAAEGRESNRGLAATGDGVALGGGGGETLSRDESLGFSRRDCASRADLGLVR